MHFAFWDARTCTLSSSPLSHSCRLTFRWVVLSLVSRKLHVTPAYLMKLTDSFHFRSIFSPVLASAFAFSFFSRWFSIWVVDIAFNLFAHLFCTEAYLRIVHVYVFVAAFDRVSEMHLMRKFIAFSWFFFHVHTEIAWKNDENPISRFYLRCFLFHSLDAAVDLLMMKFEKIDFQTQFSVTIHVFPSFASISKARSFRHILSAHAFFREKESEKWNGAINSTWLGFQSSNSISRHLEFSRKMHFCSSVSHKCKICAHLQFATGTRHWRGGERETGKTNSFQFSLFGIYFLLPTALHLNFNRGVFFSRLCTQLHILWVVVVLHTLYLSLIHSFSHFIVHITKCI